MKISIKGEEQSKTYGNYDDLAEHNGHMDADWDFEDNEELIGFNIKAGKSGEVYQF